jgi:transcriptional/translational regulatory protein YebC/TACO1
MSGHSKWATTKHRKAAQDAKRSALFSKLSRNITVAAKVGGDPSPDNNASLATAIEKAKGYSLPKDKIQAAIDKAFAAGVNRQEVIEGAELLGVDLWEEHVPLVLAAMKGIAADPELDGRLAMSSNSGIVRQG